MVRIIRHIITSNCILALLIIHCTLYIMLACANPGSGPDGGPYDETPPRIVSMTQPQSAGKAGKRGTRIQIRFSEAVQLDGAQDKIIVSPPQLEPAEINAIGKSVTVQLLDTLRPRTTYTIDFADAITDATEGNPLGRFTYIFSTGEVTDTMEVAGTVLNAEDLEPLKGVLVGLYPADSPDSVFRTQPMQRVARTDGNGRFSIKGVAEGEYRVVCLQDIDQDFRFSLKNELIGWAAHTVRPSSYPDVRYDTCWVDTTRWSRIDTVPYTHYLPDDVVVLGFVEAGQPRHKLKENRDQLNRLNFFFTAPSAEAPVLKGLNFDASCLRLEHSAGYDTLTYWICDTTVVNTDTLQLTLTYDESDDSTGIRTLRTDTLELTPRIPLARRLKQQAEQQAKWEKALERRHKRGDYSMEEPPPTFLKIERKTSGRITPMDNVRLTFDEPLDSIRLAGVHLYLGPDSARVEAPYEWSAVEGQLRTYELRAEWRPGQDYTLRLDSACLRSAMGHNNNREDMRLSVQRFEEFGTVFITIPDADSTTIVQLIDAQGKVQREQRVVPMHASSGRQAQWNGQRGGRADFYYVRPATYYYRCYRDLNGDGRWTTGSFDEGLAPEPVYYCPVKLEVKANFDFDQTWTLAELPLTQQKPSSMIRQKEKKKSRLSAHDRNVQRMREKK